MSKIAIYAGHGGTDSGAVGQNGELEKDYITPPAMTL